MSDLTSSAKVTVLIVEDEPIVRMIAVETIEEAGFEVLEAENATDAVRILESRLDIRIVFTDIDMPGSMDGLKLAAAIRGRWPPIAIIVTSGHHTVATNELPEGSVYIPKPYQHHRVIAALRQLAGQ
jgi:CheY-like chemotaxis protein